MNFLLHEILRKIKSGSTSFDYQNDADGDLEKFQDIAKTLIYANKQKYIDTIITQTDPRIITRHYIAILINGGLTFEGECYLSEISGQPTPTDEALTILLSRIPSQNIRDKWEKALHRRIADPSGAITAARSLLETTLKWIIEQRGGKSTESNKELFSKAINLLGINIKGQPIEKTIEGLNAIIWGIGDMRNKHGDAHGPASNSTSATAREAGFCVNLAGAAALFLLEEFEANQN